VSTHCFAVIPAAGLSRRMGQPKLLLPWNGRPILAHLLEALLQAGIRDRIVVTRRSDTRLAAVVREFGGILVQPEQDPPDMRFSVEAALQAAARRWRPAADDGWLLIPADHPVIDAEVVRQLVDEWAVCGSETDVLVPVCKGRRGHPTVFAWRTRERIGCLPKDRGLNWLLRLEDIRVRELPTDRPGVLTDLDTPADYQRLTGQMLPELDSET
jgi:molybdenum cofactor cytidylyltransferase